jgi:hypothetical protein
VYVYVFVFYCVFRHFNPESLVFMLCCMFCANCDFDFKCYVLAYHSLSYCATTATNSSSSRSGARSCGYDSVK